MSRELIKTLMGLLVLSVIAALATPAALAGEPGSWMARVRLIDIVPDEAGSTAALSSVTVDDNPTVEFDLTYFFTENWALEGIVATSGHEVNVPAVNVFGSIRHAPPTLTLQYHFVPDGVTRPYVGLGLNYTMVYEQAGDLDVLDIDDSFGFAAQAGIDFVIGDDMFFNVDFKYIDIALEVTDENGVLVDPGTVLGDVEVDPYVLGMGFGWTF
jgi:outer membrane protein